MDTQAAPSLATKRTNEQWLAALTGEGADRAAAERDLRAVLVAGLRRAMSRRVDDAECQDFAQEAMVRVCARLGDFRGESRLTSWAIAIAVRVAFDEMRHKRWKEVSFDALTADAAHPTTFEAAGETTPDRGLLRERVLHLLRAVIDEGLTDRQKRVLLAELQGMPQSEIALQLNMNRNALYKLSHDARRKVKAHIEASGLSAGDVLWAFE